MNDQPYGKELYLTAHNIYKRQTSMPSPGFETAIPAGERPKIQALDLAANGVDLSSVYLP